MGVSKHILTAAMNIARDTNQKGIYFKPNTEPLSMLVSSLFGELEVKRDGSPIDTDVQMRLANEMREKTGLCSEPLIAALAEPYQKVLVSKLHVLRNQIMPFIDAIVNDVKSKYSQTSIAQPTISEIKLPAIYSNPVFLEFIARHESFSTIAVREIKFMGGFSGRDESAVLKLLTTGNTTFDDYVADLIATHPRDWLMDVYNRLFVQGVDVSTYFDVTKPVDNVDELVIAYIILGALIAGDIVDGTVNVDLETYRSYLSNTFSMVGGLLNKLTKIINMTMSSGRVISHFDKLNNIVYVYEDNYADYIKSGGDIEGILGAAITGSHTYMRELLGHRDALIDAYQQWYKDKVREIEVSFKPSIAKIAAEVIPAQLKNQKADFLELFRPVVAPITDIPFDTFNPAPIYLNQITAVITGGFTKLGGTDVHQFITFGVLACALKHTGLIGIYQDIDNRVKAQPDLNVRNHVFDIIAHDVAKAFIIEHVSALRIGV